MHFVDKGELTQILNFTEHVLRINKMEPTKEFAFEYLNASRDFLKHAQEYRTLKAGVPAESK